MLDVKRIEIDVFVHKFIESNRLSFSETPNQILRRILGIEESLSPIVSTATRSGVDFEDGLAVKGIVIPNGTQLRKTLKGKVHKAEVKDGAIVYNGKRYYSPSKAACVAAKSSVNGWRFWEYFDERTGRWQKIDLLRKSRPFLPAKQVDNHSRSAIGAEPKDARSSENVATDNSTEATTPEEAFKFPVLLAVKALGGRARVSDVLDHVYYQMHGQLSSADYGQLDSGEARWWSRAKWAAKRLREEGLLLPAREAPRHYVLTNVGKEHLTSQGH